jgi:glutamyl/glutaminyl-tRNA synthetase
LCTSKLSPSRRRSDGALQLDVRASHGGKFILRIGDTDLERATQVADEPLEEKWPGVAPGH